MQPSFIPYLTLNDYLLQIRSGQLNNQILDAIEEGGEFERQEAESFAIDEIRSELGSYFYLDFEIKPTLPFIFEKKYYAGDRVVIDFDQWVAGSVSDGVQYGEEQTNQYSIGSCVIKDGIGYSCRVANSDAEFIEDNWIRIGKQYDIYFVNPPYNIFQLKPTVQIGIETPGLYRAGKDNVCWIKNIYSCRNDSRILNHQAREQYYEVNDIPSPNMFPNTPSSQYNDGNTQWIDRGEFYYKNILPSYPSELGLDLNDGVNAWTAQYRKCWTLGDNRSNTMKQIVIAIAIAKLMGRNSFQLKERSINRDWAYRKLVKIRKGEVTTLIPILQPEQIGDISWGGAPRIINTF